VLSRVGRRMGSSLSTRLTRPPAVPSASRANAQMLKLDETVVMETVAMETVVMEVRGQRIEPQTRRAGGKHAHPVRSNPAVDAVPSGRHETTPANRHSCSSDPSEGEGTCVTGNSRADVDSSTVDDGENCASTAAVSVNR